MKRWIVVVALGLAVAGGIVTPGAAQASSAAWYQVYQPDVSGSFYSIAAVSKSNFWAVGPTRTSAGKTIYTPFIRHFLGGSWHAITIPKSSGSTALWVSASAWNNVWIGGYKNTSVAASAVYRWNGARWGKLPLPAQTDLQGVVVLGPENVWAYGGSGTIAGDVYHWNGTKWRGYLSTALNFVPQGISASAWNNVWVSGFKLSGGKREVAAYRWNGSGGWHAAAMPHPVRSAGPAVTAVSRSNVWIGYNSHVLHWDGHQWHTVTTPYYADPLNVVPDGKSGYWFGAQAILTGSTWTMEQLPSFSGAAGGVTRIPGTTSFLMPAGVAAGSSSTQKPTIFRFDL